MLAAAGSATSSVDWSGLGVQVVGMVAMLGVAWGALRQSVKDIRRHVVALGTKIEGVKADLVRDIDQVRQETGTAHKRIDSHLNGPLHVRGAGVASTAP